MLKVLPIIIICSVGIAAALGYIIFVAVKAVCNRRKKLRRNEFEIDDDTLIIRLGKKRK